MCSRGHYRQRRPAQIGVKRCALQRHSFPGQKRRNERWLNEINAIAPWIQLDSATEGQGGGDHGELTLGLRTRLQQWWKILLGKQAKAEVRTDEAGQL